MIRCQKVRIYPNDDQKKLFEKSFGVARFAWNIALQESIGMKEYNGRKLRNRFTKLIKPLYPWIKEVNSQSYANSILNLGKAWDRMFQSKKKTRKGYKIGKPKFKSKHNSKQSFTMIETKIKPQQAPLLKWISHELKIPKCTGRKNALSKIRTAENPRWKQAKIKQVTISRKGDRYYASIRFEVKPNKETNTRSMQSNGGTVGIDWGLKNLLVLSDGTIIPSQNFDKIDKLIKKRQRQLSHKQKGSKNYEKAKIKLNHKTQKKMDMRDDYFHKVTNFLVRNYTHIKIENLKAHNMVKTHSLARRIMDASFYKFKTMLIYKMEHANNFRTESEKVTVELVSPFDTTQICSQCGKKSTKKINLGIRIFNCEFCSNYMDRDLNAAINIRNK